MQDFKKLSIWRRAHQLTLDIYAVTGSFPTLERYGLCTQMRRSASSVGMNIAEGCGQAGSTEFRRFLRIAIGSATELEYAILLARDLRLMSDEEFSRLSTEAAAIQRMTMSLIQRLRTGKSRTHN